MPKHSVVTYELVAEVAEGMVAKGLKPSVDSILAITNGRRDYVRRHLKTWRDIKRKEHEMLLASSIDARFAKILVEDREAHAKKRIALHQEELDNLEDDCSALERGISELHAEREELNNRLSADGEAHRKQVKELEQALAILGDRLKEKEAQSSDFKAKLEIEEERVASAKKQIADLNKELGHSLSDATREKVRADNLQVQLITSAAELHKAKSSLIAAEKDIEHLGANVSRLSSEVEMLRSKYDKEAQKRIEALEAQCTSHVKNGANPRSASKRSAEKPRPPKASATVVKTN
jgi:chromosome segregation ATPase